MDDCNDETTHVLLQGFIALRINEGCGILLEVRPPTADAPRTPSAGRAVEFSLATPDGILHLLHEMSAQCCRGFRAANRPRSAVVLVVEAARSYVGEGSWDLAEGLLLDVYARVLNDAWPLLVQDVYDLLLKCYTVLVQKSRS